MQRLILDALLQREGGDWVCGEDHPDGGFYLQLGVHDLRAVNRQLARARGGISHANFSHRSGKPVSAAPLATLSSGT